jgi:hypothetical protein
MEAPHLCVYYLWWEPPHLCGGRSALALREVLSTLITRFSAGGTWGIHSPIKKPITPNRIEPKLYLYRYKHHERKLANRKLFGGKGGIN